MKPSVCECALYVAATMLLRLHSYLFYDLPTLVACVAHHPSHCRRCTSSAEKKTDWNPFYSIYCQMPPHMQAVFLKFCSFHSWRYNIHLVLLFFFSRRWSCLSSQLPPFNIIALLWFIHAFAWTNGPLAPSAGLELLLYFHVCVCCKVSSNFHWEKINKLWVFMCCPVSDIRRQTHKVIKLAYKCFVFNMVYDVTAMA